MAAAGAAAGISAEAALDEAASHLREMSATHVPKVGELWQSCSRWMTRGYDVLTDHDGLASLRRLDRRHSLIFLISHRSYLDEFVLPPALAEAAFSPLYGIAGGNLNFFPLGTLARRNGFVHVRRATGEQPIYRLALRAFIGQLVVDEANLCWSIEGGRTRTGKLRPPRYGLLRYVADAVRQTDADPLLVPVSLMYDQLPTHEVTRMASEARGRHKQAEDLRWLVTYAAGLKERRGRIYLDFGTPVPMRARLEELTAEAGAGNEVERIALDVCHRLNAATPITPTAAVCVALLAADRALTLDEVLATVRPLADYIDGRRWPVAGAANLTDRATVRWALSELTRSQVLSEYRGGSETVWSIGPEQHLVAAVYRNSILHVLLGRAIAEMAMFAVAEAQVVDPEAVEAVALRLRDLLKFDFFFAPREAFLDELHTELAILAGVDKGALDDLTPERARELLSTARPLVAHLVLRPYFDAYRIVADQLLATEEDEPADVEDLVTRSLRTGHQWSLQRRIGSAESVSGEMFRTALRLAEHRGLLQPLGPDSLRRRREFAAEIDEVSDAVARMERFAATIQLSADVHPGRLP